MGNQGSSSQELGVKLENDITVTWKKVTSCSFPLREGQCACSQGNNMYVFGGVINDGENHIESCELLKFNVGMENFDMTCIRTCLFIFP
jgi:hypothetical protein